MNDILLGAMRMEALGKRERITVMVPRYALLSQNVLRVSFIRQLASYRCNETPEAYPASILPSSHFILTRNRMEADFSGMTARFGASSQILVPQSYLSRARDDAATCHSSCQYHRCVADQGTFCSGSVRLRTRQAGWSVPVIRPAPSRHAGQDQGRG